MSKSIKLNDDLYWDLSSVYFKGLNVSVTNSRQFRMESNGSADADSNAELILGNSKTRETAGHSEGVISFYGKNGYWSSIKSGDPTANRNILLPDAAGTLLISSKIVIVQGTAIGTDSSSISSGTIFNKHSFSLNPGTYIAIVTGSWQKNSSGFRAIGIATNSTDFSSGIANGILLPTISDDTLREQLVVVLNPKTATTYYVNVKQSSGSSLTCSCRLSYVGIAD